MTVLSFLVGYACGMLGYWLFLKHQKQPEREWQQITRQNDVLIAAWESGVGDLSHAVTDDAWIAVKDDTWPTRQLATHDQLAIAFDRFANGVVPDLLDSHQLPTGERERVLYLLGGFEAIKKPRDYSGVVKYYCWYTSAKKAINEGSTL